MFISFNSFSNSAVQDRINNETIEKSGQEISSEQTISPIVPFSFLQTESEWIAFWLTLIVAAIGVYSIYGFAAGIIAVAITYFVTNGNKKAFKLSILGCIIGAVLGILIWLAIHP